MARKFPNLVGMTFGRLIVLDQTVMRRQREYVCRCTCGKETTALPPALLKGKKASCGCLRAEGAQVPIKHGAARVGAQTQEYKVWSGILRRCTNKNDNCYQRYGGRGVTVCIEWRNDFAAFFADMGKRPSSSHSIERIDNERGYEPGNCRWATDKEQARNRRSTKYVEYNGQQMSLMEACERAGVNYDAAKYRVSVGKPFDVDIRPGHRRLP